MRSIADELLHLQDGASVITAAFDADDRLQYCNTAFRDAYFVDEGESIVWADIMRRNHAAKRGPVIKDPNIESWLATAFTRRGKSTKRGFEVDLVDGRWIWVVESLREDGWLLMTGVDITELRMDERELRQTRDFARRASQTDDLTGISNRRHIMEQLDNVLAGNSGGQTGGGCVCLFDIDYFKQVNDDYGHQAGDALIVHFARTVQQHIRRTDIFGRVGGEEFMLILPDTSVEQSSGMISRVLKSVRESHPLAQDASFTYTTSAGISEIMAGDTVESVFARADAALYASKHSGRDRLSLAA